VVVHDHAASRWPWETLTINGWAPARQGGLTRSYAAEDLSVAKWKASRRLAENLALLLVIDPTEDLAGARKEGERIRQVLAGTGVEVTVLRGGEATRARLLDEFRAGRYDAIHYAGHAFFDPVSPASSGILCAGGRVLSGADLAGLDALPALVCFNACESGRLRQPGQVQRALGRSAGFAEAFLRGGVANFIGTWWPVSDAAAARFATVLYQRLLEGDSIGRALHAARLAIRRIGSADWANYLHYGSVDFTLKP
jgi:CHAT domain-containing protein